MQQFYQNTAALHFFKKGGKSDNIAHLKTLDKVDETDQKSESLLSFRISPLHACSFFSYFSYVICKVTCKLSVFSCTDTGMPPKPASVGVEVSRYS